MSAPLLRLITVFLPFLLMERILSCSIKCFPSFIRTVGVLPVLIPFGPANLLTGSAKVMIL